MAAVPCGAATACAGAGIGVFAWAFAVLHPLLLDDEIGDELALEALVALVLCGAARTCRVAALVPWGAARASAGAGCEVMQPRIHLTHRSNHGRHGIAAETLLPVRDIRTQQEKKKRTNKLTN